MKTLIRELASEVRLWRAEGWSLGTLVWNLRFTVGYAIGGFTSAQR